MSARDCWQSPVVSSTRRNQRKADDTERNENKERRETMNTNQPPNESAIDFAELLDRVDNDRELLLDLMSIFKEDFPRHVRELSDVIGAHDLKKISVVSHTLKGMLANLAVTRATSAAARLEQLGRDN